SDAPTETGSCTEPDDVLPEPSAVAAPHDGDELDYLAARLVNGRLAGKPVETTVDLKRIESAVREILIAIGEDPDRDGLRQTPVRVAQAYADLFAGRRVNPSEVMTITLEAKPREPVLGVV